MDDLVHFSSHPLNIGVQSSRSPSSEAECSHERSIASAKHLSISRSTLAVPGSFFRMTIMIAEQGQNILSPTL